jgi:aerobic carbon-monoxide dehydrogenase medium subunit
MKSFEYLRPKSVAELVKLLSRYDGKARLLAGGTDLLVMMKQGTIQPEYLISLKDIPKLAGIRELRDGRVKIGAMTLLREIECSDLLRAKYPLLPKAAGWIGSVQVRWRATCGGNLSNGAPSADLAPPLICLGTKAVIAGKAKRTMPLEQFFLGPGQVALEKGEFLQELVISLPKPRTFGTYLKFTRSSMDIAVVGVAAVASFKDRGECTELKICLGAVAPVPLCAVEAENIGKGKIWNEEVIDAVARMASEESKPIDDVRGTIFFRKRLVEVLTKKALSECLDQAKNL